jgi:hypothetical protein
MRSLSIIGLVATAALMVGPIAAAAEGPTPSDGETAVQFLLSTCLNSVDNLDVVRKLADQQQWSSMLPSVPLKSAVRIVGAWRVSQNGLSYTVVTGVAPHGQTGCQVTFYNPNLKRDDFLAAVSKALTLKTIDQHLSDWSLELYQIENLAPTQVMLQLASRPGGIMVEASIQGP